VGRRQRDRWARWFSLGLERDTLPPVTLDGALHVDADAICPDCLQWMQPSDFVRRNAYGLLEHEACPVSAGRPSAYGR
jgi:hypothetical protein